MLILGKDVIRSLVLLLPGCPMSTHSTRTRFRARPRATMSKVNVHQSFPLPLVTDSGHSDRYNGYFWPGRCFWIMWPDKIYRRKRCGDDIPCCGPGRRANHWADGTFSSRGRRIGSCYWRCNGWFSSLWCRGGRSGGSGCLRNGWRTTIGGWCGTFSLRRTSS